MEHKDLVSVIIPTYNRRKTIVQSVMSVLEQTYDNLECIVVDDASTDDTLDVLSQIQDIRLRIVQLKENGGAAVARNRGIEVAKGSVIAFNDSDDCWELNKIERQFTKLDDDIGMVYCKYDVFLDGEFHKRIPADTIPMEKKEGNIFFSLIEDNKIGTPTMFIRKSCLEDVGYFNESYRALEDYELALRIAKKYKVAFVDEVLLKVYTSANSVNASGEHKRDALLDMLGLYKEEPFDKMFPLYKAYFNVIDKDEKTYNLYSQELLLRCEENKNMISLLFEELRNLGIYKFRYSALMKLDTRLGREESVLKLRKYLQGKKLAIYGAGVIGEIIKKRLEENGVFVQCFVDKEAKSKIKYKTYIIEDIPEDIDLIIASIHPRLYDRKRFEGYTTARIVGIDELMDEF